MSETRCMKCGKDLSNLLRNYKNGNSASKKNLCQMCSLSKLSERRGGKGKKK